MTKPKHLKINIDRLCGRIEKLAQIGALEGGGLSRLAFSKADKQGRDLVVQWFKDAGLTVKVDQIGNAVAIDGECKSDKAPVLMGSHIDTVATAGPYDGCLGVLAGLEVIQTVREAGISTPRPLAVGFFTNEEGAYIAPDMMGSMVHQGLFDIDEIYNIKDNNDTSVKQLLDNIGYRGKAPVNNLFPHTYLELHIEQGPLLDSQNTDIGVVEAVQGISWTKLEIAGVTNHAGTTPMNMRHDAGYAAGRIISFVRHIAHEVGNGQVATVGFVRFMPNLVNVIANDVELTVDLRNTSEELLQKAEKMLADFIDKISKEEGVDITSSKLARFKPTLFDPESVNIVENSARELGLSTQRMSSGAGHDAQSFAAKCKSAMIFVPSRDGISHNIDEFTPPEQIEAGANVLLQTALACCSA
jgi:N-carbamoyl-L-amino-acid hydrolase